MVAWIKRNKREWLNEDGEVQATKLAANLWGKVSYWSDVLRIETSGKSFSSKTARRVEDLLDGMPPFYLDGVEGASWPFKLVSEEAFLALSEHERGMVEYAVLTAIKSIEDMRKPKRVGIYA